jgi:hypothetical protein
MEHNQLGAFLAMGALFNQGGFYNRRLKDAPKIAMTKKKRQTRKNNKLARKNRRLNLRRGKVHGAQ